MNKGYITAWIQVIWIVVISRAYAPNLTNTLLTPTAPYFLHFSKLITPQPQQVRAGHSGTELS